MAANRAPYMPQIDIVDNLEQRFAEAYKLANQTVQGGTRQVVILTPGRMLQSFACPPPGSMDKNSATKNLQKLAPPKPPLRIAVIAFTELKSVGVDLETANQAIPFMGYILGLGYLGHSVVIFEGHPSALSAGCQGVHRLIIDGGMIPYLQARWSNQAFASMDPAGQVYVFGRDLSINRIIPTPPANPNPPTPPSSEPPPSKPSFLKGLFKKKD